MQVRVDDERSTPAQITWDLRLHVLVVMQGRSRG